MQSDTKGIETRGDAALLAAIKSGSPVPTTPEQANELTPPPAPGEWKVMACDGSTYLVTNEVSAYRVPVGVAHGLAARLTRADAMEQMLEDALPYVEECEQFNKPMCRGLSKKIRAALRK